LHLDINEANSIDEAELNKNLNLNVGNNISRNSNVPKIYNDNNNGQMILNNNSVNSIKYNISNNNNKNYNNSNHQPQFDFNMKNINNKNTINTSISMNKHMENSELSGNNDRNKILKNSNVKVLNTHLLKREDEEILSNKMYNEKNSNFKINQITSKQETNNDNYAENYYLEKGNLNLNNNFFSNPNSNLSNNYINIADVSSPNNLTNNQSKKTYKLIHQNNQIQNTLRNSKNLIDNISINTNYPMTNRNNSNHISKRNCTSGSIGNIKARSQQHIWNKNSQNEVNSNFNFHSNNSNINRSIFSEDRLIAENPKAPINQEKIEHNQNQVDEINKKERTSAMSNWIPSGNDCNSNLGNYSSQRNFLIF